uniref:NADH-ubiquinone oxidoreductase chain 1 n=1 Tax=Sphaeroma terebrans TaxID=180402 RepID=A0A5J6NI47_SPHTE|nr:NADH dehydrogenase subunit 1 [Sphaeroma terebrans]
MVFPTLFKLIILILCVLIGVAFYTLCERKALGYIQSRKGPNKAGIKGLLQPFSDAMKLFTKEPTVLSSSNFTLLLISPALSLGLVLILWFSVPSSFGLSEITLSVVFVLCCLSAGVYPTLGAGWSSNSKYSLLGSLRAVAQTISYEVSLAITLLSFLILVSSLELARLLMTNQWLLILSLPLSMVWLASSLAETNRTPFDFAEGESELVSGFNTEYSSGGFALFFLAEYASMLFMSSLFVFLFMNGEDNSFVLPMKITLVAFVFVWVRGTLPRLRYDKLMDLAWKIFLPVSLSYLTFFCGIKAISLVFSEL